MKKILLLPTLLLILLTGCEKSGTMILTTETDAKVWLWTADGAAEITVSPTDAALLTGISEKDLAASLEELFDVVPAQIGQDEWRKREGMLELVRLETGCSDTLEVLVKHGDELRGKEFMEIMDDLSGSFDDRALSKMLSRKGDARKYSLGAVLSNSSSWPETVSYVHEWTRLISLKDNIKKGK